MLKLHQIFFRNFSLLFLLTFVATIVTMYFSIRDSHIELYKGFVSEIFKGHVETFREGNATRINELVKRYGVYRVTVIGQTGDVVYDSDKNSKEMESHANRAEIMEALRQEFGISIRYSQTLKTDMLYVAKRYHTPQGVYFVRIAKSLHDIDETLGNIWVRLSVVFFVFFVLGIGVSYFLSLKMSRQTQEIGDYLNALEEKNYSARINSRLSSEFFEITRKLNELARRLAKKEKIKNKYTAKLKLKNQQITGVIEAISHEFKNPVAAIMGYTETLKNDLTIDKRLLERFLEKIYGNAKAISEMIDRLSLSMKLENEAFVIQKRRFLVKALAGEAIETMSIKAKNREIRLSGECECDVLADDAMIRLALINLLDNAIKYSDGPIDILCERYEGRVNISVSDSGIGISPEYLPKITEKFYRINKLSWDNSLGLGLNLVSMIIKAHNSQLIIESEVGKGSKFSFELERA